MWLCQHLVLVKMIDELHRSPQSRSMRVWLRQHLSLPRGIADELHPRLHGFRSLKLRPVKMWLSQHLVRIEMNDSRASSQASS